MWWLLGRKSETEVSGTELGCCSYCNQITSCRKITKISITNVWFVPISESEDIEYICLRCGGSFKSFTSSDEANQGVAGCFTTIGVTIVLMAVMFAIFGFRWWILIGVPVVSFFIAARVITSNYAADEVNKINDKKVTCKEM